MPRAAQPRFADLLFGLVVQVAILQPELLELRQPAALQRGRQRRCEGAAKAGVLVKGQLAERGSSREARGELSAGLVVQAASTQVELLELRQRGRQRRREAATQAGVIAEVQLAECGGGRETRGELRAGLVVQLATTQIEFLELRQPAALQRGRQRRREAAVEVGIAGEVQLAERGGGREARGEPGAGLVVQPASIQLELLELRQAAALQRGPQRLREAAA
mmetsp:Transcript_172361/g.552477  ORF Transcript_172361/g.552477 Transcript_172361/m.552477 type:complete len:221 (+) Transcript_172361:364-1026(+)